MEQGGGLGAGWEWLGESGGGEKEKAADNKQIRSDSRVNWPAPATWYFQDHTGFPRFPGENLRAGPPARGFEAFPPRCEDGPRHSYELQRVYQRLVGLTREDKGSKPATSAAENCKNFSVYRFKDENTAVCDTALGGNPRADGTSSRRHAALASRQSRRYHVTSTCERRGATAFFFFRGLPEPTRVIETSTEQSWCERAGETGDPRENPPTNRIVRHTIPLLRRSGDLAGDRTRIRLDGRRVAAESPIRHTRCDENTARQFLMHKGISSLSPLKGDSSSLTNCSVASTRKALNWCERGATVAERLSRSPPTKANRAQSPGGNRAGRCRLSAGFLGDLPLPPSSSQRRSIFTSITLIGSQDLAQISSLAYSTRPNDNRAIDKLLSSAHSIGVHPVLICLSREITSSTRVGGALLLASTSARGATVSRYPPPSHRFTPPSPLRRAAVARTPDIPRARSSRYFRSGGAAEERTLSALARVRPCGQASRERLIRAGGFPPGMIIMIIIIIRKRRLEWERDVLQRAVVTSSAFREPRHAETLLVVVVPRAGKHTQVPCTLLFQQQGELMAEKKK
ncbi:hypothetical protein PR048_028097 [Dryococelus australis]|uniref:Uncharacterized protein n=1 Tax=Dryococelus australis TaxID=614101 RepID=A0ABQ9GIB8_9NEOP|nr:hypothetical protein PR048_028097 [Dryococelus australis]